MYLYHPEGMQYMPPDGESVQHAAISGQILQGICIKCDENHNLFVELGDTVGVIPKEEVAAGKFHIHSIMSKVGKPVCFQVMGFDSKGNPILSRKAAQEKTLDFILRNKHSGDIIPAIVQNPASFGVFCDIGCGVTALMRIGRCCVSRLENTAQLYRCGQLLYAAILQIDKANRRIELTGRELLGTWEDNAALFQNRQTVTGIVRSILPYGIFVELTPNLSGLAEPQPGIKAGDQVSIYIRSIQPEKHKIKLSILEVLQTDPLQKTLSYFITEGHLEKWEYYPKSKTVTYF